MHKITPSIDCSKLLKCFDTQLKEQTNKNLIKVPKIVEPTIRKRYHSTLGTSISPMSSPSLDILDYDRCFPSTRLSSTELPLSLKWIKNICSIRHLLFCYIVFVYPFVFLNYLWFTQLFVNLLTYEFVQMILISTRCSF